MCIIKFNSLNNLISTNPWGLLLLFIHLTNMFVCYSILDLILGSLGIWQEERHASPCPLRGFIVVGKADI